jgi:hypothetical protein
LSDKRIKVTDRRMFTAEGQLREDYRHLEDVEPQAAAPSSSVAEEQSVAETALASEPAMDGNAEASAGAAPEVPAMRTAPGYAPAEDQQGPQFMDLVGLLAEPASLYLRQAQAARSGDLRAVSESSKNLELARMHIDLLTVLRQRTANNLTAQEFAMIDDVVYRLQLAFTQIQGE